MFKRLVTTSTAILCTLALFGCSSKPGPKSTTTTRTQTTVQEGSDVKSSDVTEKRTEQADGTKDVERTETTTTSTPPSSPQ